MASKADVRVPASFELPDIVYTLKPLEDKYHPLGVQLGVGIDQLKQIEGEHQGNTRRFAEMIVSWRRKSANCTWSALADAVDRVGGYDNLVRELRAKDASTGDVESSEDTGYSTKSESASDDSSGSEIEHFDKIPGCGCEKPCSLYTLCAGECPKPTNKEVRVVRKRKEGQAVQRESLPEVEAEEEDYAEQFENQTRQIMQLFAMLVINICDSLEKRKFPIWKVIMLLKNVHQRVLKPEMDEICKATSLDAVFAIVTAQACSWCNYQVIKDLICNLGDDNEKKLLDDYEKEYKSFAEQRKLPKGKKHIEVGGVKEGCKKLVIKIDREWDHVNFNELDRIRSNLASILNVKTSELYLADIREGCIMMTFMIPEELARRLFPTKRSHASSKFLSCLTPSQIKSLRDEGVILFTCGNFSWRSPAEQREPELSEASGTALQPHLGVQQKISQGDEFHDLTTCIQGEVEEEPKRKGDRETDHEKVEEVDLETPSHTSNKFNPPRIKKSIMRPKFNDHDQGCTHSDDPKLEKIEEDIAHNPVLIARLCRDRICRLVSGWKRIEEDTAHVPARLRGHSASSNAAVIDRICPSSSLTETPPRPCLQPQESSRDATAAGHSTLPRQKSTEAAARKNPHPKAVYSTRQLAHYIVEASTPVPPEPNSKSTRPDKLSLSHVHKRVPSATGSGHSSAEAATPAQDPPMELMSPGGAGELSPSQASCTTTSYRHFSFANTVIKSWNFKHEEDGLENIEHTCSIKATLLRLTGPLHFSGVLNAPHRSRQLNPAQSELVLLPDRSPTATTSPLLCQPPYIAHLSSCEQSTACLPRDNSNSQHSQASGQGQGRPRLWTLTESGSFKCEEDGLEDIEHSISELDMTVNDDEEDTLSLSSSPSLRRAGFIVRDCGQLSGVLRLTPTSLSSLSSVASGSLVHTSPSFSQKNSTNGACFRKIRPRSGGSLKESRPKQGSGDSPQCYRTGSLRSSQSRPMTTATNGSPSQSAASSRHSSSWMETPVRHMSTSAAVIYELDKDFFNPSRS